MATNEEFLSTIKEGCIQGWREHAVLASISGAQAILESNWGKSTLALQANNLFGIKGDYNGESFSVETKEFINKVFKIVDATFRKYPSWSESITDHSALFTSTEWRKNNYAAVVGETDYKKAAQALSDAGYATDPDYPVKLIKLIEAYDLAAWDVIEEATKMVKVYISPSSQHDNVGVGNYGTEEVRMNQIADVVESELKRVGITTLRNNPSMDITQMVAASNNFGADVHLAIHSNAGGATGAEAYYYTGSTASKKLAQAVYDNIAPMTPTADRGVKATTELYEVWATNAVATLVEIAFHDNVADAAFIINNIQAIGVAIAKGVCSYLGIDFGSAATVTPARPEVVAPVRNFVSYNATIIDGGYSIDSKPWGEDGAVKWGDTADQLNKTFKFYEENGAGYANGVGLGWVDMRALSIVPERVSVSYNVVIKSGGYSIDSRPWGEIGLVNWGKTDDFIGQTVPVIEENTAGEYINTSLGWIDKRAVEKEKVVVASILHLPAGQTWITYPENGPYKAGSVIAVEEACALRVLGDKGQGLIVVDFEGGIGRVAIRYDESKGAMIEKQYA